MYAHYIQHSVGRTRRREQKRRRFETWFWRVRVVLIGGGQKQKLRRRKPQSRRSSYRRDFLVKPFISRTQPFVRHADTNHLWGERDTSRSDAQGRTRSNASTKILYRTILAFIVKQTARHGVLKCRKCESIIILRGNSLMMSDNRWKNLQTICFLFYRVDK